MDEPYLPFTPRSAAQVARMADATRHRVVDIKYRSRFVSCTCGWWAEGDINVEQEWKDHVKPARRAT